MYLKRIAVLPALPTLREIRVLFCHEVWHAGVISQISVACFSA